MEIEDGLAAVEAVDVPYFRRLWKAIGRVAPDVFTSPEKLAMHLAAEAHSGYHSSVRAAFFDAFRSYYILSACLPNDWPGCDEDIALYASVNERRLLELFCMARMGTIAEKRMAAHEVQALAEATRIDFERLTSHPFFGYFSAVFGDTPMRPERVIAKLTPSEEGFDIDFYKKVKREFGNLVFSPNGATWRKLGYHGAGDSGEQIFADAFFQCSFSLTPDAAERGRRFDGAYKDFTLLYKAHKAAHIEELRSKHGVQSAEEKPVRRRRAKVEEPDGPAFLAPGVDGGANDDSDASLHGTEDSKQSSSFSFSETDEDPVDPDEFRPRLRLRPVPPPLKRIGRARLKQLFEALRYTEDDGRTWLPCDEHRRRLWISQQIKESLVRFANMLSPAAADAFVQGLRAGYPLFTWAILDEASVRAMSNAVAHNVHMMLHSRCKDILMHYDFGPTRKRRSMAANAPARALASSGPAPSINEHDANSKHVDTVQLQETHPECDQIGINGILLSMDDVAEDMEDDDASRNQDESGGEHMAKACTAPA